MTYTLIKTEDHFDGSVVKIILNSPKANVLEAKMLDEICEALTEISARKGIKLIVFEGSGKHFSFGASVPEHTRDKAAMMIKFFHRMFYQLVDMAIPTMAIVRGQCLGGGMELAIFCNFVVADQSAMFGQPEIVLGVFPPPASVILPLKVDQALADDLALTGRSITASDAKQAGIVNLLAEEGKDAWEEASTWIASYIAPKSATSLKIANKAVRMQFFRAIREDLPRMEALYLKELMESVDANEGINAFIEKRKPEWKHE